MLNLNVKSVFLLTRTLIPLLEAKATSNAPSRVINIGSVDGMYSSKIFIIWIHLLTYSDIGVRITQLETFAYSASKAAVHHLTKVLAMHLGTKDITVNGIAAGPFPSKMMNATLDSFREIIISGI